MTLLCEGDELRRLERWADRRRGVKFTHIALARGRTVSQPMLTLRGSRPSYEDELVAVRQVVAELGRDGFAVARVKVECTPSAAEVPRDDADTTGMDGADDADVPDTDDADDAGGTDGTDSTAAATFSTGGRHFEHHVKLLLDPADDDRDALVAVAVRHGAHVSWNARRRRPDGREERFVTQRCHRTGDRRAALMLDALLADLKAYEVIDVEREYVLLDSGPELDEGWLEAE